MKYDDASWHYGGDFPSDLPDEAGATHAGMFVAWAMLSGLAGELHLEEHPDGIEALRARSVTPGAFFLKYCDGKFTNEDVSDEGNAFAAAYFDFESGDYLSDYEDVLASELPTLYHVPDTWHCYDKLRPTLDARFEQWRASRGDLFFQP
jgi:hypothetical protein